MRLKIGQIYNLDTLTFRRWTTGDGSNTEGYSCWSYFDQHGGYLGPNEYGIEPEFEDEDDEQPNLDLLAWLQANGWEWDEEDETWHRERQGT